jgi:hypothetical protein
MPSELDPNMADALMMVHRKLVADLACLRLEGAPGGALQAFLPSAPLARRPPPNRDIAPRRLIGFFGADRTDARALRNHGCRNR